MLNMINDVTLELLACADTCEFCPLIMTKTVHLSWTHGRGRTVSVFLVFRLFLDLSPVHMTFSLYLSFGLLLNLISFFFFPFTFTVRVLKTEI